MYISNSETWLEVIPNGVSNIFHYRELKEKVYMEQPAGYGYKQASRKWFDSFYCKIQEYGS